MDSHREKSEEFTAGASVLIRAHLDSPFLLEALESIANQSTTFPFEILLALDRATPHLMDQIEVFRSRCPDSHLRLFEHSSTGIASRLNALTSHATYDFLCILDSDDRMLPTRIDKQVKFLLSNPTCAVFGSAISVIDQNGKKIGEKGFSTSPEIIRENKYSHLPIAHPSAAIRKNALISIGGYRDFYFPSEDYDLWLRLLDRYELSNSSEILTEYRIHTSQATATRHFRNYASALAAETSSKNRDQSLPEVNDTYGDPKKWARHSSKFFRILHLSSKAFAWQRAKREVTEGHYLKAGIFGLFFLVLSPIKGKDEILAKIRNRGLFE